MGQTACSSEYELQLIDSFTKRIARHIPDVVVEAQCFTPPKLPKAEGTGWADYTPLPGEKYSDTMHIEDLQEKLSTSMKGPWEWIEHQHAKGSKGVVVGISNGGVAASACALFFTASCVTSLFLLSSVPELKQQRELAAYYGGKVVMTVARKEAYFYGSKTFYSFAGQVLAEVIPFEGTHSSEPQPLMRRLGHIAARHLAE
jgi:hypothetical protein